MATRAEELAFREAVFAWLGERGRETGVVTRDQLASFPHGGREHRLLGAFTGIWRAKELSSAAISISMAYVPPGRQRPYDDDLGPDGLLRYKWRGTDPKQADNRALRLAMEQHLPLV